MPQAVKCNLPMENAVPDGGMSQTRVHLTAHKLISDNAKLLLDEHHSNFVLYRFLYKGYDIAFFWDP